ncbi:MAG: hypothetical protein MK108_03430 [Mariniblastus sp.]|nr:hypothetical protein [Mariniblastus sp.]
MRLIFPKILFLFGFMTACLLAVRAEAEGNRDYSATLAKTDELKVVAGKLRSEFTQQLRRSDVYGPLLVRTVWLKSYARQINRRARFQFNCDWRREISSIDQAVCDMEALMYQAQLRAAYGLERPIDPQCLACIYQLLGQCKSIIYALCVDGGFIQPVYQPAAPPTLPAPGYLPESVLPGQSVPTPARQPTESELIAPGPPLTLNRLPNQIPMTGPTGTLALPTPTRSTLSPRRLPWSTAGRPPETTLSSPLSTAPPVYWNGPFRAAPPTDSFSLFGN